MFAFPRSQDDRARSRCAALGRALAIALTGIVVSGCVFAHSGNRLGHGSVAYPDASVHHAAAVRTTPPYVEELEDDGLPVQTAPLRRKKSAPDDPTEPFSPNYGPQTRSAAWQPIDPVEAELAISRALAAHEQRYP